MGNSRFIFQIIFFSLSSIGGFLFWVLKGGKTKISEEYLKKHLIRNIFTSLIIFFIGFWIFYPNKPLKKETPQKQTVLNLIPKNGGYVLENENSDTVLSTSKQN